MTPQFLDTGLPKSDNTKKDLEVQDTTQNPMPKKVIETEATTELPNMSLDSEGYWNWSPKRWHDDCRFEHSWSKNQI